LRRLIDQSAALRPHLARLQIALPGRMHQRECDQIYLSLTRSHSHRAVSFCADPRDLALAMTRARHRLVLLGDPGALCKRSSWNGPLEHLDAAAAVREREIITNLLACIKPSALQSSASATFRNGH